MQARRSPQASVSAPHPSISTQCTLAKTMRNIKGVKLRDQHNPYGVEPDFHFLLQQSHNQELVSFASNIAISRTFNSLFKVLFTFPSLYLSAIGLEPVFSFRRKLPPILRTTSKVRDSLATHRTPGSISQEREFHPLCCLLPKKLKPTPRLVTHL